ncbi:hypothetical protein HYN59_01055 [Flavobacterium album]|uniref:DUF4932 domain-containing protein n=1 Tax=Flavobacterium album TaxID=2175091 RepID=A0A2S1QTU0_9FLAO|nr:hypothetical protein [Flavobacterium album]AWH83786.1 hypothetical protein HYN59_01055 [Flavobacterium album]
MKQNILTLLLFIGTFSLFGQSDVQFRLQFSEPYAVYDFLGKISDSYPDNELKSIFQQSKYNTESNIRKIAEFEQLAIDYSYFYRQYPQPLKSGVMTRDLLEKNLAVSQTLDEFRDRSVGLIPGDILFSFSGILENFLPIYHELVCLPNKDAIAIQERNLRDYLDTGRFADYFRAGLAFYGTTWDSHIPFQVNLLPSLDKDNLGARAFFNVAVCETPLGSKDHQTLFSVTMHEIYHIIYDNQSLKMKGNIQKWFNDTNSPNSQYALLLMNEVLATALGNAYVTEQLKGKIEEDDWYANRYITGMAKEIYPVVKEYIRDKKPMDEAFVKRYVGLYDEKFPQWNKELEHILTYRYIVADTSDDWKYIRRTFRYYSNSRMAAPINVTEIEKANELPITKVFIVSKDHERTLNLLKGSFDVLKNYRMDFKKEFIAVFTLPDRTKLFVINRHRSTVEELMVKYFPDKVIK